jgi:cell division septation protein DedD
MRVAGKLVLFAGLGVLLLSMTLQAQMYRWTDQDGRVHYSDSPPPETERRELRVLDERGLTVRELDRPRTREEIEEARRQEALEAQHREEQEARERRDRILRQSFGSERELIAARDDRVTIVDGSLDITDEKIRRLEEQVARLQQRRERSGSPNELDEDIAGLERQLRVQRRFRDERLEERQRIIDQFDADLERLRELKAAAR